MKIRYPRPLAPGDRIGVTASSSGVPLALRARLEHGVEALRTRGYDVTLGRCLVGDGPVSAPAPERAAELQEMLLDPAIRAVVPPWGGELSIDLLDLLDWDALARAEPTWLVGFSDLSTVLLALTTRLGWASLHGSNLMDTPYRPPRGLAHWTDVAGATTPIVQRSPGRHRCAGWDDYEGRPGVDEMTLDATGRWRLVGPERLDVTGRLVGGCLDIVHHLAATPYGDVAAFGRAHAGEGLVVYLEAAECEAYETARALHGLRLAGWFEHARAVLVGRTTAPDSPRMTQHEAVLDALGGLDVPLVLDVECGHVQPFLALVNGATARVVVDGERNEITQTLDSQAPGTPTTD